MKVEVLDGGVYAALRDGGRAGRAALGVPPGGFADPHSARLANVLAGNPPDAPLIEFAVRAPRLALEGSATVALTGAACAGTTFTAAVPAWRRIQLPAGATLGGWPVRRGVFGYLAIGGRWRVPRWAGSVGPLALGEGALPAGGVLQAGRRLEIDAVVVHGGAFARVPDYLAVDQSEEPAVTLTLWSAPETTAWLNALAASFGARARAAEALWRVLPASNRVGIRLRGPALPGLWGYADMRSAPTLPGTVQLAPDGTLLVGGVDGPTMGGYPRIGHLEAGELARLAQVSPGHGGVRFVWALDRPPTTRGYIGTGDP